MTDTDYIEPGTYRDSHGGQITVGQRIPDGRYLVTYGQHEGLLSARTIRQLYRAVTVVAVGLALLAFTGATQAAVSHSLLAKARKEFLSTYAAKTAYDRPDYPLPPAGAKVKPCVVQAPAPANPKGPKAVVCTATWPIPNGHGSLTGGWDLIHGKLVWDEGLLNGTGQAL